MCDLTYISIALKHKLKHSRCTNRLNDIIKTHFTDDSSNYLVKVNILHRLITIIYQGNLIKVLYLELIALTKA